MKGGAAGLPMRRVESRKEPFLTLNVELLNCLNDPLDVQFFRAVIIMTRTASRALSRKQFVYFS